MSIFNLFRRKKKVKEEKQFTNPLIYKKGVYSGNAAANNNITDDLANPLNPISPFWIGNVNNYSQDNSVNSGTGSLYNSGSSGSYDSGSSSYDSGSSSSYDSSSSSSDSSSSSSSDF